IAEARGAAQPRARPVRAAAVARGGRRRPPFARIPGRLARSESADGRRSRAGAALARRCGLYARGRVGAVSGRFGERGQQALLSADRRLALLRLDELVRAVRLQEPGLHVVGEIELEIADQPRLVLRIEDRIHDLDAAE